MKRSLMVATVIRGGGGTAVTPPTAPTGLTATPVSTSQIDLAWTDNATDETEYRVYRSTDNSTYSLIDTIAVGSTSYADTTITSGTTYYYKVAAYNTGGESLSSAASTNTLLYGLIEFVPFDEASGDATGVNGKVFTNNGSASYAAGQNGNAGVAAAGKYWNRASESDLQSGNISFTVACKVYVTSAPGASAIMAKGSAATLSTIEWGIAHTGAGMRFTFDLWQSSSPQTVTATDFGAFSLNTWYSIVAWVDTGANTINISVNGTVTSATKTKTPAAGSAAFGIGAYGNGAAGFLGRVEDVVPMVKRVWTEGERTKYHSSTYPFDTAATVTDATVGGQAARYIVPVAPSNGVLVMYHHGTGEVQTAWQADALKKAIRDALIADGYLLCASNAHANNWGNAASAADYEALYTDAVSRYPTITKVVILSQSMGGLSGLTCVANSAVPVAGWYGIYPICSLAAMFANNAGTFATEIRNAYGIAVDGSDYATKTNGYDPLLRTANLYDIPMRFTASAADTVVSKADNSDAMSAYVAAYADEETVVVCSGNHGDPSHFDAADVIAFFERC